MRDTKCARKSYQIRTYKIKDALVERRACRHLPLLIRGRSMSCSEGLLSVETYLYALK